MTIQDQVTFWDRFTLTGGARFDHYEDFGDIITPRIAGVYRPAKSHVIKAQYSEGFRAPTFWEAYRTGTLNENLDFEVIGTSELIYIFRIPSSVARLTLFYSEIEDMIFRDPGSEFENSKFFKSQGIEAEWEQKFGDVLKLQAGASYMDAWDGRNDHPEKEPQSVSAWLGNIAFYLTPVPKLMISGRLHHAGERFINDGSYDGYDIVDLTVSSMDLLVDGLTLRMGAKNVIDDDIVYLINRGDQVFQHEYIGRTFWARVSYEF